MRKLFFVFGPESAGNHVSSLVLQTMGCFWKEPQKLNIDVFIRGECTLKDVTDNENIVLRRSVPYEREWTNPSDVRSLFEKEGYKMYTIILQRDWMATMLSQYYHRSTNVEEAWDTLVKGEKHIASYVSKGLLDPFYILNTSTLMKDPEPVIKGLEIFTGLKWPKDIPYQKMIYDADAGRHQLLLDRGFKSIDRVDHKKYFKRPKPLVLR
jgi:hypothetical protein